MNRHMIAVLLTAGILLFSCLSVSSSQELKKLSLDDPSTLGLRIETDPAIKAEGKASVKITTAWPVTVCLGRVDGLAVENAALNFKAKVRSDLEGQAFLEMWVLVGGKQYFSRGLDNPISGKTDWRDLRTPFFARNGQKIEKAWLNLVVNGQGTVWVDDAGLSQGPLPAK